MNIYRKLLLLVIFFSGCAFLDKKIDHYNCLEETCFNEDLINKNYINMTREQIIYIFGHPVIPDSFIDVYHYYLCEKKTDNICQKKMLNFYFKNDKVIKFSIK